MGRGDERYRCRAGAGRLPSGRVPDRQGEFATGVMTGATGTMTGKTAVAAGPGCSGNHELDDQAGHAAVWASGASYDVAATSIWRRYCTGADASLLTGRGYVSVGIWADPVDASDCRPGSLRADSPGATGEGRAGPGPAAARRRRRRRCDRAAGRRG